MHTLIILLFTAGVSCLISRALIWRKQLEAAQYLQLRKLKLSINIMTVFSWRLNSFEAVRMLTYIIVAL
jgi:hypothetical protein